MRLQLKSLEQNRSLILSIDGAELTIDDMRKEEVLTIISDVRGISLLTEPPRTEPDMPEQHETRIPRDRVTDSPEDVPETLPDCPPEDAFFQKLSAVRRHLAQQQNVPPYLIFNDKSLRDMIQKLPTDMTAFRRISGVGSAKLEKYGIIFLKAIAEYMQNKEVLAG